MRGRSYVPKVLRDVVLAMRGRAYVPKVLRDVAYCYTWNPNNEERHQSLTSRACFYTKIRNKSKSKIEPRTFGLANLSSNHWTTPDRTYTVRLIDYNILNKYNIIYIP